MIYHIHIYEVINQYETNIEANNEEDAKQIALNQLKKDTPKLFKLEKSDCKYIALSFKK